MNSNCNRTFRPKNIVKFSVEFSRAEQTTEGLEKIRWAVGRALQFVGIKHYDVGLDENLTPGRVIVDALMQERPGQVSQNPERAELFRQELERLGLEGISDFKYFRHNPEVAAMRKKFLKEARVGL